MHDKNAYFDYIDTHTKTLLENSVSGRNARRAETYAVLAVCSVAVTLMCLGGFVA